MNEHLKHKYMLVLDNHIWLGYDSLDMVLAIVKDYSDIMFAEVLLFFEDGTLIPNITIVGEILNYYGDTATYQ